MYQVLGHDRAAAIDAVRLPPQRSDEHDLHRPALLALRQRRRHAARQGLAADVPRATRSTPSPTASTPPPGSPRSSRTSSTSEIPHWRTDNQYFRSVYGIDPARIAAAHNKGKLRLFATIAKRTGHHFNPNVLTLGFARRVATYKRASLLLHDPARLVAIAEKIGGLQILYAGKAHPADNAGKGLIRDVYAAAAKLNSSALKIYYVENYDWELGALLTQGVDVWVNTPRRPYEASGTSGMKAALNGVPSLSILDGWWIEGCAENTTGWAIEDGETEAAEANSLYDKLEKLHRPHVRQPHTPGPRMQQHCIAINGSFFNTHRMLAQYFENSYFPPRQVGKTPASPLERRRSSDILVPEPALV